MNWYECGLLVKVYSMGKCGLEVSEETLREYVFQNGFEEGYFILGVKARCFVF